MDKNIEKLITDIVEAKLEQIVKKVDTLQRTVDKTNEQLGEDRKDISDVKVSQKKIEAIVNGARDDIESQTKRVISEVKENLQPMPDIVGEAVSDAIGDLKKKKWYQLFKK